MSIYFLTLDANFGQIKILLVSSVSQYTLHFRTPENFGFINLKFKQRTTLGYFVKKDANRVANSEDPYQSLSRSSLIWVGTVVLHGVK